MEALKVSIITICLNNEETVEATVASVLGQSYPNIEYIVVDGASTDGTLRALEPYKSEIACLISEPDKGLYDAINKGLHKATGDVVGLIHAGDRLYDANIIEKIVEHFDDKKPDVMYGHSILVNADDHPVRVNRSPAYKRSLVQQGWMPSHQSIYMKRSLLDQFGYYNLDLHPSSDYEFFLRYFYFNKLKVSRLDEYVLRFAMGGRSTRDYRNNLRAQKQHVECWRVNGEEPPIYLVPLKLLRKPIQFIRAWFWQFNN
ncbi:MAG: glycosyltransferase [Carboxylicivirga sp.]|jgi:glycosyltransferase|nr:glycosyltransferase [Carboxylicivirga sp.]